MLYWAEDKVSFESEKQNRPIDPSTVEWGDEYFDYPGFWFDEWLPQIEYSVSALGLDPSKGRDARKSDYSAYLLLKRDFDGWLWVQADMRRRPTEQIVDDGLAIIREHKGIDALICEATMFQHLFEEIFFSHGQAQGVDVPFIPRETNVPKIVRIRTIGPYLRRQKIRFHRDPMTQLLVEQLRDFPNGDHDDGPDALEMALSGAIEIFNGSHTSDPTAGRRIAI
jgi:predicted phage terminase large subunit-like protein